MKTEQYSNITNAAHYNMSQMHYSIV